MYVCCIVYMMYLIPMYNENIILGGFWGVGRGIQVI